MREHCCNHAGTTFRGVTGVLKFRRGVPISCLTKGRGRKVTNGVAARIRKWLNMKMIIKFTFRYSILHVTNLSMFYYNFIDSFLFFFATQAFITRLRFILPVKKFFIILILLKFLSFFATPTGAVNNICKWLAVLTYFGKQHQQRYGSFCRFLALCLQY